MTTTLTPRQLDRFMEKILPEPNSGCWLWMGHINNMGYGRFQVSENLHRTYYAHRIAYEHFVEPIPAGLDLDHKCRVTCCVNPQHLEPVTRLENMRRGKGSYTHCHRGHPLSGDNLYVFKSGARRCCECHRLHNREWDRKKRLRLKSQTTCVDNQ